MAVQGRTTTGRRPQDHLPKGGAPNEALATPAQVAEYLGYTVGGLAQWRYHGTGPKFIKLANRQIRYRWADIEAWLDQQTRTQTGDAA